MTDSESGAERLLDAVIIGAGPTGLATSIECRRRDVSHLVFDKGSLVDSIRRFPVDMVFFTTPELLEIGGLPFVCAREKPVRLEALKYYRRVAAHHRLPLRLYECVERVTRDGDTFRIDSRTRDGEERFCRARAVVLAMGYYDHPNLLGIPGEELPKTSHYFVEAHPYFGHEVAVIGGGNSAAETALELFRAGVRVTLIHREDRLSRHLKYWVRPDIENRIERHEIQAHFETTVEAIRPRTLELRRKAGSRFEIPNDFVLAMTGYHPDEAFLASMGIDLDPATGRASHDAETFETNVPGIYVAGAVGSGRETNRIFIENGRSHGVRIAAHLASRR